MVVFTNTLPMQVSSVKSFNQSINKDLKLPYNRNNLTFFTNLYSNPASGTINQKVTSKPLKLLNEIIFTPEIDMLVLLWIRML